MAVFLDYLKDILYNIFSLQRKKIFDLDGIDGEKDNLGL
jgi:hypothetical protein